MAQEIFERYEKKYMMTEGQFKQIMPVLQQYLEPDQFQSYQIRNLYYDTSDYQLIRSSLEKPLYKEKVRLRSYGDLSLDTPVYLELKKKFDGVVYKRRAEFTFTEAEAYLKQGKKPFHDSQILHELDYTMKRYDLKPAVFLSYERSAWHGKEDPQLRMTFDTEVTGRSYELDLRKGCYGARITEPREVLMEVKIPGAMPVWMSRILSEFAVFPVSFSKYGTYYLKYIMRNREREGGENCA